MQTVFQQASDSIFHRRGVNALTEDQTLTFGKRLTIVYGDNGAGKTGYIRVLKSACHTRAQETILGNVITETAPHMPVVAIKYSVDDELSTREWNGEGDDDSILPVSIFDTQSASIYLTDKTDVAFRPFGLDLFDKLVQACKSIRTRLEAEKRTHETSLIKSLTPQVPEGTAVAKILSNLTALTKVETVKELATISEKESAHLELLEQSLLDLQANDPTKLTQQLKLRATRINKLTQHLKHIEKALSAQNVAAAFKVRLAWHSKQKEADQLHADMLTADLLAGTGSDSWKSLWHAARTYSQQQAYPDLPFPVTATDALCVLCQQKLDNSATHRLKKFQAFVDSTMQRELQETQEALRQRHDAFANLSVRSESTEEIIKELQIEHEALATKIEEALTTMEDHRKAVAEALETDADLRDSLPPPVTVHAEVFTMANQLNERVKTLRGDGTDEKRKLLTSETEELRARVSLAKHQQAVLEEIERKKRIAAFDQCINETNTKAITQKSSAVTRAVVTKKLKDSFRDELYGLNFRNIEVELEEAGGAEGVLYHKLVLKRAPRVDLPKIVSEGEQHCLSIAAFFAELSTSNDSSGIVFDDPVSSLDYRWREDVARRLVQASKDRQVIVFTHDVVFLLQLRQFADEDQVDYHDQHIRRIHSSAGICAERMPWVAMPVKAKIGCINNKFQDIEKLHREGYQDAYEKEAKYLYGLLREAWERALEEVLLCGVVERYRPSVQTRSAASWKLR